MLGRHEQQSLRRLDRGLETGDRRRHRILVILIVHRQVVDLDKGGVEGVAAEGGQSLGQFAVDRRAPVAADDDAELEFRHESPYLSVRGVTNDYQG